MPERRLIYHNDTRHTYLYAFEPPMTMRDAQRPVDEIAGTGVDTLVSHVGDWGVVKAGLFYRTKLGLDWTPPTPVEGDWWRARKNLESLWEKGLDPISILADRAHEKGMEFFGSLRMNYGNLERDSKLRIGGETEIIQEADRPVSGGALPGFDIPVSAPAGPFSMLRENHADYAREEVRKKALAILDELARSCALDGIELDWTITPFYFRKDAARENTLVMTDLVRQIAKLVRGEGKLLSARVFPTEEINLAAGLDVRAWIREGLIDLVTPLFYGVGGIDPQMPYDWLIELARAHGIKVYPMVEPGAAETTATASMMRAAAANAYARGADGVYTWGFPWPLGPGERGLLTELAAPDFLQEADKLYVFRRRARGSERARAAAQLAEYLGYPSPLPISLEAGQGKRELPFYLADHVEEAHDRLSAVTLRVKA
ncbi:MAG: hypothetical protein V2A58_17695, partial [Planctomycetota bacterium]